MKGSALIRDLIDLTQIARQRFGEVENVDLSNSERAELSVLLEDINDLEDGLIELWDSVSTREENA